MRLFLSSICCKRTTHLAKMSLGGSDFSGNILIPSQTMPSTVCKVERLYNSSHCCRLRFAKTVGSGGAPHNPLRSARKKGESLISYILQEIYSITILCSRNLSSI